MMMMKSEAKLIDNARWRMRETAVPRGSQRWPSESPLEGDGPRDGARDGARDGRREIGCEPVTDVASRRLDAPFPAIK